MLKIERVENGKVTDTYTVCGRTFGQRGAEVCCLLEPGHRGRHVCTSTERNRLARGAQLVPREPTAAEELGIPSAPPADWAPPPVYKYVPPPKPSLEYRLAVLEDAVRRERGARYNGSIQGVQSGSNYSGFPTGYALGLLLGDMFE